MGLHLDVKVRGKWLKLKGLRIRELHGNKMKETPDFISKVIL